MKVQIDVDGELWKLVKADAALAGQTLGEYVAAVLERRKLLMRAVPVEVQPDKPKVSTSAYTR